MARFLGQGLFGLTAAVVFLLDQGTKFFFRSLVPPGGAKEVIPGFFRLVHLWNPGVAFGLMAHHPAWARYFLSLVNLFALVVFYFMAQRAQAKRNVFFCGLIAGGALGNLFDRLFYGRVFDFLDFYWGPYHWPAFNLADASISIGIMALLVDHLLRPSSK